MIERDGDPAYLVLVEAGIEAGITTALGAHADAGHCMVYQWGG